jgi:S-adenosylmethionine:tRNA ribosyltransferase-isomerase
MLHTSDFDFELPPELIASHPLERRDASRMLVVDDGGVADKHIRDFLAYIQPGDVVVFNNSRVIPARFDANGHEITLHTAVDDKNWWGLCRKFTKIHIGDILTMADGTTITVVDKDNESGLLLRFNCDNVFDVLGRVGKMPLPPYMKREAEIADQTRYQTVYADPLGSMAAPTAGLHFTPELMAEIENRGAKIVKITLHVGAGTWMPVKTENLNEHKMHSEWCCITPEQAEIINNATRVIAVGTTSLRTLESAARNATPSARVAPICQNTDIFITPGYKFRAVDVLLTNFHLPKSTLFMLVSAFSGLDEMKAAYKHAVSEKYRFFSYGDCCLLFKKDE